MTLDQAIDRFTNNAEYERIHGSLQGCLEFRQYAEWLKDYKRLLEQQPVTTTNNDEPITIIYPTIVCEDAIRRDAVKKWICKTCPDDSECQGDCDVIKGIDALPPVTPQQKYGKWILADEQNKEDVENDNYRFICSECQCSDIHAKGTIVPYCWKCGAKMQESEEV